MISIICYDSRDDDDDDDSQGYDGRGNFNVNDRWPPRPYRAPKVIKCPACGEADITLELTLANECEHCHREVNLSGQLLWEHWRKPEGWEPPDRF